MVCCLWFVGLVLVGVVWTDWNFSCVAALLVFDDRLVVSFGWFVSLAFCGWRPVAG